MKYIIGSLIIILAFSSYMALSKDYEICRKSDLESAPAYKPPPVQYQPPPVTFQQPVESKQPEARAEMHQATEDDEDAEPEEYFQQPNGNEIVQEIFNAFGSEFKIALAIARAESGLNPAAVNVNRNGSRDIGIFQINDAHGWSAEERFDWRKNIWMAKELRDRNGWTEWAVFNNGQFRQYI